MKQISVSRSEGLATLIIEQGNANAVTREVIDEVHANLEVLAADTETCTVMITGAGNYFSLGFDIQELHSYSRHELTEFVTQFTALYAFIRMYPKPIVAALNGDAHGAGYVLAMACDKRLIANGNIRLSEQEQLVGAAMPAYAKEMLCAIVGNHCCANQWLAGKMYSAREALSAGLVSGVVASDDLLSEAIEIALMLGATEMEGINS